MGLNDRRADGQRDRQDNASRHLSVSVRDVCPHALPSRGDKCPGLSCLSANVREDGVATGASEYAAAKLPRTGRGCFGLGHPQPPGGFPMAFDQPRVPLCSLFERRSQKGNPYISGFLGKARIVGFVDEKTELRPGTERVWTLFLVAGESDGEARAKGSDRARSARAPRARRGGAPAYASDPAQHPDRPPNGFDDDIPL